MMSVSLVSLGVPKATCGTGCLRSVTAADDMCLRKWMIRARGTGQSHHGRGRTNHPHPNPLPEGEGVCRLIFMLVCTLLHTPVSPLRERARVRVKSPPTKLTHALHPEDAVSVWSAARRRGAPCGRPGHDAQRGQPFAWANHYIHLTDQTDTGSILSLAVMEIS